MDPQADRLLAKLTRTEKWLTARRRSRIGPVARFWTLTTEKLEAEVRDNMTRPGDLDRLVTKGWLPSQASALMHTARTVRGEPGVLLASLVSAASIARFVAPPAP